MFAGQGSKAAKPSSERTDVPQSEPGMVQPPALALPKGGGAIRGMGEKFAANPVTGTGSMSVPIATSPGRGGFGPQLALSYDSGAGNGPFGLGWNLSVPAITRKTDKGLPQYRDAEESDVFILSGAEDLVPMLTPSGERFADSTTFPGFVLHRYRPRIEGLFARIERWTNSTTGEIHWRSITKENITTFYGKEHDARIFDPEDPDPAHPTRIFTWLICQSYDDKGNAIVYNYAAEDDRDVDHTQANERNRVRTANRYLKHIRYGNRTPALDATGKAIDPTTLPATTWMFEVVFDYGEHNQATPLPNDAGVWPRRADPFSTYRAGFEVRTYRLCQRVLMFHHFPDEPEVGVNCLVRSTDFTYAYEADPQAAANPIFSKLLFATQTGYNRQSGGYMAKSLPPLEFTYSEAVIQTEVLDVDAASLENLPMGLDGAAYQWVDLDGEGLSGILTEQVGGWFYKRNLSPLNEMSNDGAAQLEAKFAPLELIVPKPAATLAGQAQFLDLAGDGQIDLVQMHGPVRGFYERVVDEQGQQLNWSPFRPFPCWPNVDLGDPNLKFVDLTGDGHADILITEGETLTWHPALAEDGYGPAIRLSLPLDEERGARLVFADSEQAIYLADLSGDGLTDLVRIRNGEVCYWPNLGYGRFGAKVTMDNAPWFDAPDQFSQQRIRLADIDGSGTTDIMYLHRNGVRVYFNQSGNGWAAAQTIPFPAVDNLTAVQAVDLLGDGTACLVWSSPLPGAAQRPMHYLKLMGEQKPHLLVKTVNNLGMETVVQYAPSTRFYLQDKLDGKSWITKLPFPVHVVERVETLDRISGNRFVTRHAYHHGYFDGVEREFHGFGMVEQWDTEEFAFLRAAGTVPATNLAEAFHVPPVLTKTWFHTGAYPERERISNFFAQLAPEQGGYYQEPGLTPAELQQRLLADTVLPTGLTTEEEREACRALKGAMLRQEVYALDGTAKAGIPYTVTEHNFTIDRLQPLGANQHAVFFIHPREAISYHYERNPADPRIQHALTLEVDPYGNVLKTLAIGYGRRAAATDPALTTDDKAKQTRLLITYTDNSLTNAIDDGVQHSDDYRTPLPAETQTFELTGFQPENNVARFSFDEWTRNGFALLTSAVEIPYEQTADDITRQKRLIEHVRARYRKDDLNALLPLGGVEPLALPGESYKLAFTPGLLNIYASKIAPAALTPILQDEGKYVDLDSDGHWWIPAGRVFFSTTANLANPAATAAAELAEARQHFFLPRKFADPFGNSSVADYDIHDLLVVKTEDALRNTVTALHDYRVLQPRQMTDPNGNRTAAAFDALGMMVGTAVMGKAAPAPVEGDSFATFTTDLTPQQIKDYFDAVDPRSLAVGHLGTATTRILYDLERVPACAATIARETHVSALAPGAQTKVQLSFSYSDGFGRELQKKIQAEPGTAPQRDANGQIIVGANGQPVLTLNTVNPRWVGSGWTVFNNKGKPVRQFEPFFSDTHQLDADVRIGVSPTLFYDPVERVVATLHPNHTWEKVVFDSWQQTTYDVNDTVTRNPKTDDEVKDFFTRLPDAEYLPTWHEARKNGQLGANEQAAAAKAALHAHTPTVAHADALGRPFLTLADNGADPAQPGKHLHFATRVELDIEGNQRAVIDARDRVVMRYDYDMLGTHIHQASMEAGERWMLGDVAGKLLYAWDSRNHQFRTAYDPLRRPTDSFLREGAGAELLIGRAVYGESRPNPEVHNLREKVVQLFDQAGVVTSDDYDFKGNLVSGKRDLRTEHKTPANWAQLPAPATSETFTSSSKFDALGRVIEAVAPDGSVTQPRYNEANLLEAVDVRLGGAAQTTPFVRNIDYDAKGQRTRIEYNEAGHPISTEYAYDPDTFRLTRLVTRRPNHPETDERTLQDFHYTYDPAGNITHIQDDAQQTVYFRNQRVEPSNDYVYDAVYRLISAQGREHLGQTNGQRNPPTAPDAFNQFHIHLDHPGDSDALGTYSEEYEYDAVGNFQTMRHRGSSPDNPGWTRSYAYHEPSLLEPATQKSNRLSSTQIGAGTLEQYRYDEHGNMTAMPHLPILRWDFADQLTQVDLQGGGTAYYVYDASGQRMRKVVERNGATVEERIYLGGYEVYRKRQSGVLQLERETLHVMDDQQRIALVETRTQGEDGSPAQLIRFQFGNHLGSASLELDDQANVISYEEYYPYGSTSYQAVHKSIKAAAKRYRYTGMERDEESGFEYHGARYCAPWLGRWVSCDPLGLVDGFDLYIYAGLKPINYVDPAGTDSRSYQDIIESASASSTSIKTAEALDYFEREALAAKIDAWEATVKAEKAEERYKEAAKTARRMTRVGGGLKVVGGALEIAVGCPLAETGIGAIGCIHGIDTITTGGKEMWSGKSSRTMTHEVIKVVAGLVTSESTADKIGGFGDALIGGGTATYLSFARSVPTNAINGASAAAETNAAAQGAEVTRALPPSGVQLSKFSTKPGGQANYAGHGILEPGAGELDIPGGSSLIIPRDNIRIINETGLILESGDWGRVAGIRLKSAAQRTPLEQRIFDDLEDIRVLLPGDKVENYTLTFPKNLTVYERSTLVGDPTDLGDLLGPNMGCKIWAACTEFVPKGR